MVHQYKNNGYNIVLDVNSGAIHIVDDLTYDVIALWEETSREEIIQRLNKTYDEAEIKEAIEEIEELQKNGDLFTPDDYEEYIGDVTKRPTVVKALCLHIAHDCNLACRYCFAEEGEYLVTIQEDSKEKKIHFVIDKTPPAVHISNLEKDIYEEEEHNFTIGIMDNYAFERMELYVEKSTIPLHKKKVQKFIIKPEDLDKNHMVNQKITEDTAYQTIHYIAWDKAGNKLDSNDNGDTRKCLVTTNKPVKEYYKNNPRSQIIMGIVIAATVFTSGCIAFYNRKKHR